MIRSLSARTLEVAGLVTLPVGLYVGVRAESMFFELAALAAGALLFLLGRAIEPRH